MNKLISVSFGVLFLSCKLPASDSIPALETLLSKKYSVEYSVESGTFTRFDSPVAPKTHKGLVNRVGDYMQSRSDSTLGILEDTNIVYLDKELKMISLGPARIEGPYLINPFYDPYEIIKYAEENNMRFVKYEEEGKIVYEFFAKEESIPVVNIIFYFNKIGRTNDFSAKLIYQQREIFKKDIIQYKFVENMPVKDFNKISDIIYFGNGKYSPKKEYGTYTFFNAYLL